MNVYTATMTFTVAARDDEGAIDAVIDYICDPNATEITEETATGENRSGIINWVAPDVTLIKRLKSQDGAPSDVMIVALEDMIDAANDDLESAIKNGEQTAMLSAQVILTGLRTQRLRWMQAGHLK